MRVDDHRSPIVELRRVYNVFHAGQTGMATTSSESALPKAMQAMERFGVPRHIVGFVMPTGYSFNLDGSTLYLAMDRKADCFAALRKAIELNPANKMQLPRSLAFESVRLDPEFRRIVD